MGNGVFIAVPCYGGQVYGLFASKLAEYQQILRQAGVRTTVNWLFTESHIARGRDTLASDFLLRSDCAVMQWLDADLEFSPAALALQTELVLDSHADAIGGNYPGKAYFPDQLAPALAAGLAPQAALNATLKTVTKLTAGDGTDTAPDALGGPLEGSRGVEVMVVEGHTLLRAVELPTGLLTVHRKVFAAVAELPGVERYQGVDGKEVVKDCFGFHTDAFETRTLRGKPLRIRLSEDYAFCARAKQAGFELWSNPHNVAAHWGIHRYGEPSQ